MSPSTAVAIRESSAIATRDAHSHVDVSPMSFEQVVGMGDALVKTGFLPQHIKTGAQAAAIILTGRELGMPPMRALRSLQMVKGKVTENADSQLARFKSDGGRAQFTRLDEECATLKLRHPNGDEHTESFTMEDAKRAGLLNDQPNYRKYPKAMLRSRVITAALKSIGWEGGAGNYDPDEMSIWAPGEDAVAEPLADAAHIERLQEITRDSRVPMVTRGRIGDALDGEVTRERALKWITAYEERFADEEQEESTSGTAPDGEGDSGGRSTADERAMPSDGDLFSTPRRERNAVAEGQ